jgi:hypothetical protein
MKNQTKYLLALLISVSLPVVAAEDDSSLSEFFKKNYATDQEIQMKKYISDQRAELMSKHGTAIEENNSVLGSLLTNYELKEQLIDAENKFNKKEKGDPKVTIQSIFDFQENVSTMVFEEDQALMNNSNGYNQGYAQEEKSRFKSGVAGYDINAFDGKSKYFEETNPIDGSRIRVPMAIEGAMSESRVSDMISESIDSKIDKVVLLINKINSENTVSTQKPIEESGDYSDSVVEDEVMENIVPQESSDYADNGTDSVQDQGYKKDYNINNASDVTYRNTIAIRPAGFYSFDQDQNVIFEILTINSYGETISRKE